MVTHSFQISLLNSFFVGQLFLRFNKRNCVILNRFLRFIAWFVNFVAWFLFWSKKSSATSDKWRFWFFFYLLGWFEVIKWITLFDFSFFNLRCYISLRWNKIITCLQLRSLPWINSYGSRSWTRYWLLFLYENIVVLTCVRL